MRKKYIITFITEFFVLASNIVVYKLAAVILGSVGFSEYALSRRVLSFIQPAVLMGLTIGIPRYMGYYSATSNDKSGSYFLSGASLTFLTLCVIVPVFLLLRKEIAFLLFGSPDYSNFIFPINVLLIGTIGHSLCYSYFRGKLFMGKANLLQILNSAIFPLAAFGFTKNIIEILNVLGLARCLTSFIFLAIIFKQLNFHDLWKTLFTHGKELIRYSIPRVPGDFGWAALLSIVAFLTAHSSGVKEAGNVAFGISMLNAGGSLFYPIGIVLLPHASQMVAKMEMIALRKFVKNILLISQLLSLLGIIVFAIFGGWIIEFYLGRHFVEMTFILKIIFITAIPYTIFVTMANVIDSFYIKAINTKNILISLSVFLLLGGLTMLIKGSYIYLIIEFVTVFYILGLLTLSDVKKIFKHA
jgi:O-antigen/teichoic acid export membrane protein